MPPYPAKETAGHHLAKEWRRPLSLIVRPLFLCLEHFVRDKEKEGRSGPIAAPLLWPVLVGTMQAITAIL